jgi:hypothetical protein
VGASQSGVNLIWDHVSFINCTDTGNLDCFRWAGSTDNTTGTRKITNTTMYNTSAYAAEIQMHDVVEGQSVKGGDASDVIGIVAYRTQLAHDAFHSLRNKVSNSFFITDISLSGGSTTVFSASDSITVQDNVYYAHFGNPHHIAESTAGGGSPNLYTRNVCDGDNYVPGDPGDFVLGANGSETVSFNLNINACGTLITALSASSVFTVLNNTMYNSFGISLGETNGSATQLAAFRNNLTVNPNSAAGVGGNDYDGVHTQSFFIRQSALVLDYNGFWQMPGSADIGAPASAVPALLTHPTLGQIGYVRVPLAVVGSQSAKSATAGTTTTTVICTGCSFTQAGELGVIPGDFVLDTTSNLYDTVASITNATTLVLTNGISTMASGRTFDVRKDYKNTSGAKYGDANFGANDLHANPQFTDPTRTLAKWDIANGGPGTMANIVAQAMKLNGWDINGNPATYNTAYNVMNVLSYIRTGFTPTNTQLKGAGSPTDGSPDIGALAVAGSVNSYSGSRIF